MMRNLYWQRGYAAFSMDANSFDRIFNYVKNQEVHHVSTNKTLAEASTLSKM